VTLDCLGQRCPLPIIELARAFASGAVRMGDVVTVLADDPAAGNDIAAWCRMRGQEFTGSPAVHTFVVRRVS
jgi:tRNA 2-thiouridine synthesizing protein A